MVAQLDVVLSKVSRNDPEILHVLDKLKLWSISPEEAMENLKELFGSIPSEPALYCFFLMFQMGEETILVSVEELKESVGLSDSEGRTRAVKLAMGDIISAIEEECPSFKKDAVSAAKRNVGVKTGPTKKAA